MSIDDRLLFVTCRHLYFCLSCCILKKNEQKGGIPVKYCPYCGAGLDADMRFCPKCGKPFEEGKANPHIKGKHVKEEIETYIDPIYSVSHNAAPAKKTHWGIIALAVFVILAGLVAGLYFGGLFKPKADPVNSFSDNTSAIAQASNSVVMLNCYDKDGELYATGSGFVAFENNVIVTNYHVISGDTFSVIAVTEDGREFEISTIETYDIATDIAIVRIGAETNLVVLSLGDTSTLEKGEKVTAIGSPLGLINTVSTGTFSGIINDGQPYLQFSAPVSHGSSGGALFNSRGEVVGITSASYEHGQNINLAIPIETVIQMWNNHFSSTSMSLARFYSLQEHELSIDDLYANISFYISGDGSKKVTINGYIAEIDVEKMEITIANTPNGSRNRSIIVTNLNRFQLQGLDLGTHVKLSGKIIVPISDRIVLDGKLSMITIID